MKQGTIKWFSDLKGYGYITALDGSGDVHFSNDALEGVRVPAKGDVVSYELDGYPYATRVTLASVAAAAKTAVA